ncbi:MMPL family transporter [Phytohabitans suffuscus]|uniref:MMPL family transporter n=1 Tax=Phytohabitans suffuscus TaxID=624315 RepID=UPI001E2F3319|nr:MMPL family transporter [Phytohabitans suffuscus]
MPWFARPNPQRLTSQAGTRLEAIPTREVLAGTEVSQLVGRIRATPAPFERVVVGGFPAELTDFRTTLMDRVPLVAALVLAITFVLLFLMSGSPLIPIKSTVLNLLSLSVMFGVLVFVFQERAFASLLGFTPIGTLDPAFPILMFCVAYGLSMDYEVFMLSRIKEHYEATGDNTRAVLEGLQRSAPLITSAAAIIVDATIIRAILIPALMRLAGPLNWWAPGPLRRLQHRIDPRGTAPEDVPRPRTEATPSPESDGRYGARRSRSRSTVMVCAASIRTTTTP